MTLPQRVAHIIRHGLSALYPCVYGELNSKGALADIAADLEREIKLLMPDEDPKAIVAKFIARLGEVRRLVETDVSAAYDGDPAATSRMEIVMAYPGVYAVTIHRLAHELYKLGVPVIPRVMSELAHSKTGIDIHPGATIGERFFIDHGTGVVIGETTIIGNNVRLYQGVTLGGLSFTKDSSGALVKGLKRHPNIEDNVVIYANATILGGETTIGHDSEIGGNVWIKDSVPPCSRVYNRPPQPVIKTIDLEKEI
ncbi:MAG: serine acetyltransferase [Kiritimatiellae bacterium]|nr:serine acetyltransferase [Kiritimatiellia bacterium]